MTKQRIYTDEERLERKRARHRAWLTHNADKAMELTKRWKDANRDRVREYNHRYHLAQTDKRI